MHGETIILVWPLEGVERSLIMAKSGKTWVLHEHRYLHETGASRVDLLIGHAMIEQSPGLHPYMEEIKLSESFMDTVVKLSELLTIDNPSKDVEDKVERLDREINDGVRNALIHPEEDHQPGSGIVLTVGMIMTLMCSWVIYHA